MLSDEKLLAIKFEKNIRKNDDDYYYLFLKIFEQTKKTEKNYNWLKKNKYLTTEKQNSKF